MDHHPTFRRRATAALRALMNSLTLGLMSARAKTLVEFLTTEVDSLVRLQRLGRDGDGGYVVDSSCCDCDYAISAGIGDEDSLDLELARRGLKVLQFDHTVPRAPSLHENLIFTQLGVCCASSVREDMTSIKAVLDSIPANRVFVKIDIEGDEWALLHELLEASIDQVVVEFHGFHRTPILGYWRRRWPYLRMVKSQYAIVHAHINTTATLVSWGEWLLPDLVEVTFLRRGSREFVRAHPDRNAHLDRPNRPGQRHLPIESLVPPKRRATWPRSLA